MIRVSRRFRRKMPEQSRMIEKIIQIPGYSRLFPLVSAFQRAPAK
jgi:hypothetical protein